LGAAKNYVHAKLIRERNACRILDPTGVGADFPDAMGAKMHPEKTKNYSIAEYISYSVLTANSGPTPSH